MSELFQIVSACGTICPCLSNTSIPRQCTASQFSKKKHWGVKGTFQLGFLKDETLVFHFIVLMSQGNKPVFHSLNCRCPNSLQKGGCFEIKSFLSFLSRLLYMCSGGMIWFQHVGGSSSADFHRRTKKKPGYYPVFTFMNIHEW